MSETTNITLESTVVKMKPTSPGLRGMVVVKTAGLHKGRPHRALVKGISKNGGRNSYGRITTRHKGGGHKRLYRVVDFKRNKIDVPAKVERFEYDPNRSAHLALLLYADGERRYILAPKGLCVGDKVISRSLRKANSEEVEVANIGDCLPLCDIMLGSSVHNIELRPGKGGQLARSAGVYAQLVAKEGAYVTLRLRSGETRKILKTCRAVVGEVCHAQHSLRKIGKAGKSRNLGIRPTVRGVVMNPVDHPHGGGEGRTSGGRHPVSPWGTPTKGYKTRTNKRTSKFIVRRRKKRK